MKCATCRKRVAASEDHCPHCGTRLIEVAPGGSTALIEAGPKKPAVALVLGVVPGLTQFYLGQTGKGFLFLLLLLLSPLSGGLAYPVLVLYSMAEGWNLAKRLQSGEPVSTWGTLWDPTWRPFA